jgi:endoglucanase Acf2
MDHAAIEMVGYQSLSNTEDDVANQMKISDIDEIVDSNSLQSAVNIGDQKQKRIKIVGLSLLTLSLVIFIGSMRYRDQNVLPTLSSSLSRGSPFKIVTHPDTPTGLWGIVSKPYPTGAFWTNLVVKNGDGAIGLYPYGVKTLDVGVQVSYGATRRSVTRMAITDSFLCDIQISTTQSYTSRSVEGYDNISVTMGYRTSLNGRFRTHLVKSSPFVTTVFDNATPVISSPFSRILSVDAKVMNIHLQSNLSILI